MGIQKFNRIKSVLADKGVKSKELAAGLEVSELTVSRWARNARQPNIPTLFKIADFLDVDVCILLVSNKEQ